MEMGFVKFILGSKKESRFIGYLTLIFAFYYIFLGLKVIGLLENGSPIKKGPFPNVPFQFNLFNFDPIVYYGRVESQITHPFFRFISLPLEKISHTVGNENFTFLVIQSLIVSLTTVLIYTYCRNLKLGKTLSVFVSGLFGFSSYSTMVAFVPDSYAYAQFFIVLSIIYLQYVNHSQHSSRIGLSTLTIINMGITLTNIIPFVLSTLVSCLDNKLKRYIKTFLLTFLICTFVFIILALIDKYILPGESWVSNINGGLQNKGYIYVDKFSWGKHSHVLYALFIAPFLFPRLQILDPNGGLKAIVTNFDDPFPSFIKITGFLILFLAILGLLLNLKKRNVWILVIYISFSVWLHLIKGYGLATYKYDLFLYAGHFLFAIVLGVAWLGKTIKIYKPALIIFMAILLFISIIQIGNNYKRMGDLRDNIQQVYIYKSSDK